MTTQQKERVKQMIDEALAPLLRGGPEVRLREAEREYRRIEEARRRDDREDKREDKKSRKESRRFFESIGMDRKAAKRAAEAGPPPDRSPIQVRITYSESETRAREAQREAQRRLAPIERKVRRAELKECRRAFEAIGMPKELARLAATGRR